MTTENRSLYLDIFFTFQKGILKFSEIVYFAHRDYFFRINHLKIILCIPLIKYKMFLQFFLYRGSMYSSYYRSSFLFFVHFFVSKRFFFSFSLSNISLFASYLRIFAFLHTKYTQRNYFLFIKFPLYREQIIGKYKKSEKYF